MFEVIYWFSYSWEEFKSMKNSQRTQDRRRTIFPWEKSILKWLNFNKTTRWSWIPCILKEAIVKTCVNSFNYISVMYVNFLLKFIYLCFFVFLLLKHCFPYDNWDNLQFSILVMNVHICIITPIYYMCVGNHTYNI